MAQARGLTIGGAALARRDTERSIHVDPLQGFELSGHVLQALDAVVDADAEKQGMPRLAICETALVLSLRDAVGVSDIACLTDRELLEREGALWVTTAPAR